MKRQSADVGAERPLKQIKSINSNSDSEYWEREYRKRLANSKDAQTVHDTWQEARNYISLNQIHLTTALKACQNDSGVAMQIMREARLEGLQPNIFHFTCLLRIPGTPTKKILKRMEKDSIEGNHWSWNAALTGCPAEEVWDILARFHNQIAMPSPAYSKNATHLRKSCGLSRLLRNMEFSLTVLSWMQLSPQPLKSLRSAFTRSNCRIRRSNLICSSST